MSASTEEQKGYARGYAAGRRTARAKNEQRVIQAMREQFEREVFLAVLPELVRAPWQTEGQRWSKMEQFITGARKFATLAGDRFNFTPPPMPVEQEGGAA